MKKIWLFAAILTAGNFVLLNAQTNEGRVILGASSALNLTGTGAPWMPSNVLTIGVSSSKFKTDADGYEDDDPTKTTSINLLPKVGYFVIDNLALGLDFNIYLSSQKDDIDKSTANLLSTGPFIRYYFPSSKVLPFVEVNGSFGTIKTKYENDYTTAPWEETIGVTAWGGGLGIGVPLGDRAVLDLMGGYNSLTIKDKDDNPDNSRMVTGTFGLELGFTMLLGS